MPDSQAAASYRRDLGDGLVQRWFTAADVDKLAYLMGLVWRASEDEPPNPRIKDSTRREMRDDFPLSGPGDVALIEDTREAGKPIVACASLWREEWTYEEIPLGVGRPENVATHPAYRKRGLVRALFEMLHAHSAREGHLVQVISGIPHFYRQFGYEYALDFGGRRVTYLSLIPPATGGVPEAYGLREATVADVPRIMELYNGRRAAGLVWANPSERYWRYMIERWSDASTGGQDPTVLGMSSRIQMIVDSDGVTQGYAIVAAKRWGRDLLVYGMEPAQDINLQAAMPSLLRALQTYGMRLPAIKPDTEPLREISFSLGRTHPVYDALGQELAPFGEPPFAWYVRVPDLPRFIRHIAPALERRLASSVVAGYTGELKLDFYRGGLRMVFARGHLMDVAPWNAPVYHANADAGFPPLVFTQLLFGYRSVDELRYAFPDVRASSEAQTILNALFPVRPSWVMQL